MKFQSLISKAAILSVSCLVLLFGTACQPDDIGPQTGDSNTDSISDFTNGVFIINEGNFTWGNGSLSFYEPESSKAYNHLFDAKNDYPLGDVPQSIRKGKYDYCLTVNNSNSVVFCDFQMNVIHEFNSIDSPRYTTEDEDGNVYISSLYGKQILKINKERSQIDTFAYFKEWTEDILWHEEHLYIAQKRFGETDSIAKNILFKLNNLGEKVDSLSIGQDIDGIKLVANEKLALLSNSELQSKIWIIELADFESTVKEITGKASFLSFSGSKNQVYYFKEGIYSFDIASQTETLIKAVSNKNSYGFNMDALRSEFYLVDAKDFISKGDLLRYNFEGNLLDSVQLSIIPGEIYLEHNL